MATLEQQAAAIDAAQATLDAGRKALLRADGTRVYSDAEHVEREAQLYTEYRRALAAASKAANEAIAAAEATLSEGPDDPLHSLTPAELDRANALREFVREDAATLPLRELVDRVEAALRVGGKPELYLWQRGVRARLAALPADRYGIPTDHRELVGLEALLGRLDEKLTDPAKQARRERERAEARERQAAAMGVIGHAAATSIIEETYGRRGR
jgi:hypothetical protein